MDRMNQAERNLLKYLQSCVDTPSDATPPTDTAIVCAFQALDDDYADSRERAVHDLRSACDEEDYKLMVGQAGNLGGVELT